MEKIRKESLASELLAIIFIQKKSVQLSFLLVFLCFIAYATLTPDSYQANGAFLVKAKKVERNLNALEKIASGKPSISEGDMYSEAEILSSINVVRKTATKIFKKKLIDFGTEDTDSEQITIEKLRKQISAALTVSVLQKSRVLEPIILWHSPEEARIVLKTLMWTYLEQRQNIESPDDSTRFLGKQVTNYLAEWDSKKSELLSLVEKYNAPNPEMELKNNLLLKKHYVIEINKLEQKRDSLKAETDTIESMLSDGKPHVYSFLSNGVMSSLVDSLQSVQKDKEEVEKVFLPSRIEVQVANNVFKNSYKTIKGEVELHLRHQKSILKTANKELLSIKNKLKNLEHRNIELKKLAVKMEKIQMESKLMASSFEIFYKRRDESQLKGTLQSNVAIVSDATSQLEPVQPMRVKIILLGLFFSITFSLALAFLLDAIDQTIKTPRDVENYLYAPVLFSIEDVKN